MVQASRDQQRQVRVMMGMIPEEVPVEEIKDRVFEVAGIMKQAGQARTPDERMQLTEQARRILEARPRAATAAIVVAKTKKAEMTGHKDQAEELLQQARDELLTNPPAARRPGAPVAKAKAAEADEDQLIAVHDSSGTLTHVARVRDLTPVIPVPAAQAKNTGPVDASGTTTGAGTPKGGPAEALPGDVPGREVTKAKPPDLEQIIKGLGPGVMPVHDRGGRLVGAVQRSHVTAIAPGQVLKGAEAASRANVYDAQRRRVGTARLAHIRTVPELTRIVEKAAGSVRPGGAGKAG